MPLLEVVPQTYSFGFLLGYASVLCALLGLTVDTVHVSVFGGFWLLYHTFPPAFSHFFLGVAAFTSPPFVWSCFLSLLFGSHWFGAAHPYLVWCCFLLLGGAALSYFLSGGAAFPSSFWVVLLFPLAWCSFLLPPLWWCCFPLLVLLGRAAFPSSFYGWWCRFFLSANMKKHRVKNFF